MTDAIHEIGRLWVADDGNYLTQKTRCEGFYDDDR